MSFHRLARIFPQRPSRRRSHRQRAHDQRKDPSLRPAWICAPHPRLTRVGRQGGPSASRRHRCHPSRWGAAVLVLGMCSLGSALALPGAAAQPQPAPPAPLAPPRAHPPAPSASTADPSLIRGWQITAQGVRITIDTDALQAMMEREAPRLAQRAPDWVRRGFVWGTVRYVNLEPEIDSVSLFETQRRDQVAISVRGGIRGQRERGIWRWDGLNSGLRWRHDGAARVADLSLYGRIVLTPAGERDLAVTAIIDALDGNPRLRFLDRMSFHVGTSGHEVHHQRITLPNLDIIGLAVTKVTVAEVKQGDLVLDLVLTRAAPTPAPTPAPTSTPAPSSSTP